MIKKKKTTNKKVAGRNIVDDSRRHNADKGGRNPLTEYPLVPVGVVFQAELIAWVRERQHDFINPLKLQPYGVTALCRVICQLLVKEVPAYSEKMILNYLKDQQVTRSGRKALSHEVERIIVLIPKPIVLAINDRVRQLDNSLIGTSTIVRFMVERGLRKLKREAFYEHIPMKHASYMIKNKIGVDDLIESYQNRPEEGGTEEAE